MESDSPNEHLRELTRIQAELLAAQNRSFAELISLQKQLIASHERDTLVRKKLLILASIILAVWLVLTLAPIWF